MLKRGTHKNRLWPSWIVAVAALLLLVLVLSSIPVAVCCFLLLPVFLFSLIELPSFNLRDQSELVAGFEDGSPTLFQRPPPSFA